MPAKNNRNRLRIVEIETIVTVALAEKTRLRRQWTGVTGKASTQRRQCRCSFHQAVNGRKAPPSFRMKPQNYRQGFKLRNATPSARENVPRCFRQSQITYCRITRVKILLTIGSLSMFLVGTRPIHEGTHSLKLKLL